VGRCLVRGIVLSSFRVVDITAEVVRLEVALNSVIVYLALSEAFFLVGDASVYLRDECVFLAALIEVNHV